MTLQLLECELVQLRRFRGDINKCNYTKSYLEIIKSNATIKQNDKRLSAKHYGDMKEIIFRCNELISKF